MTKTTTTRWHHTSVAVNGSAIRHIRLLMSLSVVELAHAAGISADYLYKIESGAKRRLGLKIYQRMLHALRIDDRRVLMADPSQALPDAEEPDPLTEVSPQAT